ncbi:MAG: Fur family transcriptional regulator [Sulfurimonadaceae bacterium]
MQHMERLKEHTLKVTPQRTAILEEIEVAGHIDVDTLYEILRMSFPTISLATVYKNVSQMYDLGILEVIKVPKRKPQYEIRKEPHIHLACDSCGTVMDMEHSVDKLMSSAESESGYHLNHSTVVLNGTCPSCQSKSA